MPHRRALAAILTAVTLAACAGGGIPKHQSEAQERARYAA